MLDMGFQDAIDDVIRFAPALCRHFCFRQPGSFGAISGRKCSAISAIEIDSTDALPPIEQQFYELVQQRQNSSVATVIKLASAILLRGVLQYQKRLRPSATRWNEVKAHCRYTAIWSNAIAIRPWYVL